MDVDVSKLRGMDLVEAVLAHRLRLEALPPEAQERLQVDAALVRLRQDEEGRFVGLRPLLLGQVEIFRTPPYDLSAFDEQWMYADATTAAAAWLLWADAELEPSGWVRHMPSGRRGGEER